jgi:hypothetical protein
LRVLRPFVLRLTQPAHAQHHHLALARRQAGAVQDEATERAPAVVEVGVMSEGLVDVEVRTTREHRLLLRRAIFLAERRNARRLQARREALFCSEGGCERKQRRSSQQQACDFGAGSHHRRNIAILSDTRYLR